jgi:hypothetical protein
VALAHPRLLCVDLNENPGEHKAEHQMQLMKYAFLKNIKSAISRYHKSQGDRIKLEWVHPAALGQIDNDLDSRPQSYKPTENRELFIKLVKGIAKEVEMPAEKVMESFIGQGSDAQD